MSGTLVIMLPGAMMEPRHYLDAGFDAALGRKAELHLPAIDTQQIDPAPCIDAIRREVIAARAHYRHIVLGGISLGAMAALHYLRRSGDPHHIDGLCLIAPYPGIRTTAIAIRRDGAQHWRNSTAHSEDPEHQLWHWLIDGAPSLPTFFGYGQDDRFADGIALMADMLPACSRHVVPGAHDWPAWRKLWDAFVDELR